MSSASRLLLSPLLIARVQPRVGSVLAIPTLKQDLIQNKTPEGVCVVRVPYMRYNEYLVKASLLSSHINRIMIQRCVNTCSTSTTTRRCGPPRKTPEQRKETSSC